VKYPKQLYITLKYENEEYPLGFLHAYEPNKAPFLKKKKTQDDWAYGHYHWRTPYEKDGKMWVKGINSVRDISGGFKEIPYDEIVSEKLQPRVVDNVPLNGFKIQKSVSRYSTSNKLWRILDPRGYEFEISTGCFEEIVLNTTIINGVIQDKCVWIGNKNLAVVKEL